MVDDPNPTEPGCLLVLGMHRSGTSAVTAALAGLGLSVGDPSELLQADSGNPAGYWEPAELIALNDAVLATWGAGLRNPRLAQRPAPPHTLPPELLNRMSAYAKGWERHAPFVWKDPRLCLTLPFWRALLTVRGVVLAARHPLAVAQSLHERDGMSLETGLVLWEAYVRSLLSALDETPRIVVRYEDLMERSEKEVERLARFASSAGVRAGDREAAWRRIERRPTRRLADTDLSPVRRDLYRQLCEGNPAPDALSSPEVLALLDDATQIGSELTEKTSHIRQLEAKIQRMKSKAARRTREAPPKRGLAGRIRSWIKR